MNTIYNHALKQANGIKRDLDLLQLQKAEANANSLLGQLTASLAAFARTVDEYDAASRREMVEEKREKAKERVLKFRQDLHDYRLSFAGLKADREQHEMAQARVDLIGRRPHASATPDNPYAYQRPINPVASFEDATVRQKDFLGKTGQQLDEFLDRGRQVLGDLAEQRGILQGTQTKVRQAAETLGVSRETIRSIEYRLRQDKWIFCAGALFTLVCFILIIRWLR